MAVNKIQITSSLHPVAGTESHCQKKIEKTSRVLTLATGGILFLLLLSGTFFSSIANAQINVTDLSNNEGSSILPQLAIVGDSMYAVWQDSTPGNFEVFFASSIDAGATFSEPVNIGNTGGPVTSPRIAAEGSNVYVIWQDGSLGANEIFFTSSADGGTTFEEARNISNDGSSATFGQVTVVDNNALLVVWQGTSSGNDEIYLTSSNDAGASFSDPINISNNEGSSITPQVDLSSNGTTYVTWVDSTPENLEIFFSKGINGTFAIPLNVSSREVNDAAPRIDASDESDIAIIWAGASSSEGADDIFVASSTDAGDTFSEPMNISENEGSSLAPLVSRSMVDPGSIIVAWQDSTGMDFGDIFVASSTDGAQSFSDPINVSVSPGPSFTPALARADDQVFLAWSDSSVNFINQILFASSVDGGDSFGCPINLSTTTTSAQVPQIATLANGTNTQPSVIWQNQDEFGSFDVLLSIFNPQEPAITIDIVSNTLPLWDIDQVEVSGGVGNAEVSDSVTVDWGDGEQTADIPISGCSWGPVSHPYAPSTVSQTSILSAKLIASDGDTEKTSSSDVEINTQKHFTVLTLEPVSSIQQGSNLSVSGTLLDGATGLGMSGHSVSFSGSGATNLEDAVTGADGIFTSTTNSTGALLDHQIVQAHYMGDDEFLPTDSNIESYDTVSPDAIQFNITAGQNVEVDLEGFFSFNGSITFDDVVEDGIFFASECESPESARYTPVDVCLRISSAVTMVDGTKATVALSLPNGTALDDISLFHEEFLEGGSPAMVDITSARDPEENAVLGRTSSFSEFVAGIALHAAKPIGAHRQEIFVGSDNEVALRDITNLDNSSASTTSSFDKSSYGLSDTATLTITDYNGNVSNDEIDIVQAMVKSGTSTPFGVEIVLTETDPASSIFQGTLGFTTGESSSENGVLQAEPDDTLSVGYLSGGRFQAVIQGLDEAGFSELSDFVVESSVCMKPIGGAVELKLIDARLGPSGLILATLSYANADLRGFDPSTLRLVQKQDAIWIDITQAVDLDAMTVTGETSIEGAFTLAVELDDCGGGSGGGLGRPGSGLVVDFVASIARPPSGGNSDGGSGGGGGGGSRSVAVQPRSASSGIVPAGEENEVVVTMLSSQGGTSSGIDVNEIKLVFQNVTSAGTVDVVIESLEANSDLFDTSAGTPSVVALEGANYTGIGGVYDIEVSSQLSFEGTADITIPYDQNLIGTASDKLSETDVRFLHHDGVAWRDVTIELNTTANTVTGRLTAFSPVVAAVIGDGTFGSEYFEVNPLAKMSVRDPLISDGGVSISTQGVARGQDVTISATLTNAQRANQGYVYIVEIFSPAGHVENIMMDDGLLGRAETLTISNTWKTAESQPLGTYEIKILVFSSIEGPEILAQVATTKLDIVNQ